MKHKNVSLIEENISIQEILEKRLFNVFVFGLPRSGTSMMSGIVERLGVRMIHTSDTKEELEKRNENERKRYGDEYHMNKDGFFEITENLWDHFFEIMCTPYSGCKMIIPVRADFMHIVKFNPVVKVIQMWRDPEEIRQSQQASYDGNRGITEDSAETKRAIIRSKLVNQKLLLDKHGIDVLHVQYRDVLDNPNEEVKKIAAFINAPNKIDEAVKWVSKDKIRFKKEEITKNI